MTRIELTDSIYDASLKVIEGNPGAATVVGKILNNTVKIDPDNVLGGMGPLLHLDTLEIYGPRIWMLYKDVCGENIVTILGILRANQLGYLDEAALNHAIDNYGKGIDVKDLVLQVKEHLPNFESEEEESILDRFEILDIKGQNDES